MSLKEDRFINNIDSNKTQEIQETLVALKKEKAVVTVFAGRGDRNSFDTQISLSGCQLDQHPENETLWRCIHSKGTYFYTSAKNIHSIGVREGFFEDNSKAVIRLNI